VLRKSDDSIAKQPMQWTRGLQRQPKITLKRNLEKETKEGRLQVQLEEDGAGSTRHKWSVDCAALGVTRHRSIHNH